MIFSHFFFNDTPTTEIYTLSLHDALPILAEVGQKPNVSPVRADQKADRIVCVVRHGESVHDNIAHFKHGARAENPARSEEHTSELQSHVNLVCRLLLEKKKNEKSITIATA